MKYMSEHSTIHHTFSLERSYDVPPATVFAAWSDQEAKRRWFAGSVDHYALDFAIGGEETVRTRMDSGREIEYVAVYRDIVEGERLVVASEMRMDGTLATLAIMTVEFDEDGGGTRLRVIEQDTFLDGHELPQWREEGTAAWLDKLAGELVAA
jgi:uncharacterized protein YndB with AHSA1/START domain